MDQFTKKILVEKEERRFEFTRMTNFNGVKFFVTSKDDKNKPVSFSLTEKDRSWKLLPGSQRWLYQIEAELEEAILETRMP